MQYLSFGMAGDSYAVPVTRVREVLEYTKPVQLPKTEHYLKGIINLRDAAIPVMDLRLRLGLEEAPLSEDSAIIVLEGGDQNGEQTIGALTDEVHEVIEIDGSMLEKAPAFGGKVQAHYVAHIGKKDNRFIIILDIDPILYEETATNPD